MIATIPAPESVSFRINSEIAHAHEAAPLAIVPAPILQVAAQFASVDPSKGVLSNVCIRTRGCSVAVIATNGHIAFRCRLAIDNWRGNGPDSDVMAQAAPIKKAVAYAHVALIHPDRVEFCGGKRPRSATGVPSMPLETRYHQPYCGEFPHLDQVWPDPSGPIDRIALNAGYLETISKAAGKLSDNGVLTWQFTTPTAPAMASTTATLATGECLTVEFLIMPVQIRS